MSFELDAPKSGGVNLQPRLNCKTCDGDSVVVFSLRTQGTGQVEEYAPCPDCNPTANTRREGFRSPDPAKVRERLSRQ